MSLGLYRRHLAACPHRDKGRSFTKCSCPIWADGINEGDGLPVRRSLETRDWQRAIRKLAALEDPRAPQVKSVEEAIVAFEDHLYIESSTRRKYRNVLRHLREHLDRAGVEDVMQVTVERLDSYRASRRLSPVTSAKELQTLRQFFGFCGERGWMENNPAKHIKPPRNIKPAEIVPYTDAEIAKILAASDQIGRAEYERRRARAMVLLLYYTALRISDVAMLERDRVRNGEILVRTQKKGTPVRLPITEDLEEALRALPLPRGAGDSCRYFFWNGDMSRRAVVGTAERTMAAVFKTSGVEGAHAHRFRHTLATRLLGQGASFEQVADILGNSPAIVRKHYAKWSTERQEGVSRLFAAVFGKGDFSRPAAKFAGDKIKAIR